MVLMEVVEEVLVTVLEQYLVHLFNQIILDSLLMDMREEVMVLEL
jgi:hypothetical protein